MKNGKIANINTTIKNLFFKWLDITKPFHRLTNQQQNVLALILYYNYIYVKDVPKDELRWKLVFNYDTRMLIKEELDLKDSIFQNILTKLRKKNIIKLNKVVSTYIPNITQDSNIFKVIFNFKIIKDEQED